MKIVISPLKIMVMDKKYTLENIKKTALFILGILIYLFGYYSNEKYKEVNNIDSTTGATQTASK